MINASSGFSSTSNPSTQPSTPTTPTSTSFKPVTPTAAAANPVKPPITSGVPNPAFKSTGGAESSSSGSGSSLKPKKKFNLKMMIGMAVMVLIVAALGVGLYLQNQNQDNRQQASGWCTGQDQCPSGYTWGGGEDYCAPGLKYCTQGGGGTPASPAPVAGCKATGNSASACNGFKPGDNRNGVCTCQFSSLGNNDCACIAPTGSCTTMGGTCYSGSQCSGLTPARSVVNGGGGCSTGQVCCGGATGTPASPVPTLSSCTATCSGSAVCTCPSGCNTSGTVTAGSTCGGVRPPASPAPNLLCNANSDATCVNKNPGTTCVTGGQSGQCTGVGGGPCSCGPGTGGQTPCTTFTSSVACNAVGYCSWEQTVGSTFSCRPKSGTQSCTYQGTTYAHGTRFCTTSAVGNAVVQCNNASLTTVTVCPSNQRCVNGACAALPPTPTPSIAPQVSPSPTTQPSGNPSGNLCPNPPNLPVTKYLKFTCPQGCQKDGDGLWRCNANREESTTKPTLNGACGQIDALSGASDATYCGYTEYTCDQARCQGTTSTPPPASTPGVTPSPAGPMCLNITMAKVSTDGSPVQNDAMLPVIGDAVRFTCAAVPTISNYTFRVIEPDGTIVPLQATGNNSAIYTISKSGRFSAQCQICTGTTASSCKPFATITN